MANTVLHGIWRDTLQAKRKIRNAHLILGNTFLRFIISVITFLPVAFRKKHDNKLRRFGYLCG